MNNFQGLLDEIESSVLAIGLLTHALEKARSSFERKGILKALEDARKSFYHVGREFIRETDRILR